LPLRPPAATIAAVAGVRRLEFEEVAMEMFTIRRIEDLPAINHGAVRLAGDELGVESFGLQVLDLPPDFAEYPEHDHAEDGQEEVYVVLDGGAEFVVDGEHVQAGAGALIRVEPAARRKLRPGPGGVRLLAIGCVPSGYERPPQFRVAARA
jgi:mannose-6-phosphate isomerase-like protein (cupin superfamily)